MGRLCIIISILVIEFWAQAAYATTVFPKLIECPVCRKEFVVITIGSYIHWGIVERDLTDLPKFTLFGRPYVCPHCLYAAWPAGFDNLTANQIETLKDARPKIARELVADAQANFGIDGGQLLSMDSDMHGWLLVRQWCRHGEKGFRSEFDLLMSGYAWAKQRLPEPQLSRLRLVIIQTLKKGLTAGEFQGTDEATMMYLLGELSRVAGDETEALVAFDRARKLVAAFPAEWVDDEGEKRTRPNWVAEWCDEQQAIIKAPKFSKKPESPANPLRLALAQFNRTMLADYVVKSGDTLSSIGNRFCPMDDPTRVISRLLGLNPHIKSPDLIRAGEAIRVPQWPEGFSERRLLQELLRLSVAGELDAARCLARWVETTGNLDLTDELNRWMLHLSQAPDARRIFRETPVKTHNNDQRLHHDLLLAVCEDSKARDRLRQQFPGEMQRAEPFLMLQSFTLARDPSMKDAVFNRLSDQKLDLSAVTPYISVVGTAEDLPVLERVLARLIKDAKSDRDGTLSRRHDIEAMIRAINTREQIIASGK